MKGERMNTPITILDRKQVRMLTEAVQGLKEKNEWARAVFVLGIIDRHSNPKLNTARSVIEYGHL